MLAMIVDNTIQSVLAWWPSGARRLDNGEWFTPVDPAAWTPEEMAIVGLQYVVETARPADTQTQTTTLEVVLIDGVPTMTWVWRNMTAEELKEANENGIDDRLVDVHMLNMLNPINTTNATINAGPAPYIKDTARAIRSLIRKVEKMLDTVE